MNIEKIKLVDICSPKQWKTIPTTALKPTGYPVYGANGIIGFYDEYNHSEQTILITCRGATCGSINITEGKVYVTGNAMCLDNLSSRIDLKYLYHQLTSYDFTKIISGTAQPQITREGLQKAWLTLHPLEEQRRIASLLDKIDDLRRKRQEQIDLLDTLVKSRFVEMFGDIDKNEHSFKKSSLESVSDIVSGITKGRKVKTNDLTEVPYLAVSNVKDGYLDYTILKTIMATTKEISQYRIMDGDILMTEGGDPDKLGRGALIRNPPKNCIHQNHIFRVRLNLSVILPEYFNKYLQIPFTKKYFLKCSKQTTGIASINMKQLKALPVFLPSILHQKQFSIFVNQTDKSKLVLKQSLAELETLKKALMQKFF